MSDLLLFVHDLNPLGGDDGVTFPPPLPPPPPPVRTHVIQRGESLQIIAARLLGNANLWRAIWELNKDKIPNPHIIRAGIEIEISNL